MCRRRVKSANINTGFQHGMSPSTNIDLACSFQEVNLIKLLSQESNAVLAWKQNKSQLRRKEQLHGL